MDNEEEKSENGNELIPYHKTETIIEREEGVYRKYIVRNGFKLNSLDSAFPYKSLEPEVSLPCGKAGRPYMFQSAEEVQEQIDEYFERCQIEGKPLTMTGLAVALGIDRKTLLNYQKREDYIIFPVVKSARQIVQRYMEEHLFGKQQVAGAIFSLKNNFEWVDKREQEVTIRPPVLVDSLDSVDADFEVLNDPQK